MPPKKSPPISPVKGDVGRALQKLVVIVGILAAEKEEKKN